MTLAPTVFVRVPPAAIPAPVLRSVARCARVTTRVPAAPPAAMVAPVLDPKVRRKPITSDGATPEGSVAVAPAGPSTVPPAVTAVTWMVSAPAGKVTGPKPVKS